MAVRKQPNGTYLIEFQLLGERVHRSSGTTSIREARALEEELRREVRASARAPELKPERPRMTLGDAVDRYLDQHLRMLGSSARSLRSTEFLLKRLVDLLGGRARHLDELGRVAIQGLRSELLALGRAPATVNQYLAYTRAVVRKAELEWGVRVSGVPIRLMRLKNGRDRALSIEEEGRLLGALDRRPALSDLVRFLLATGARLREATSLAWEDVDLDAGRIRFRRTKNGDPRVIPIAPGIQDPLRARAAARRSDLVNPYYSPGVPPREYRWPHGAFRQACDRAEINDLRLHDLRHTFASRLVGRGVSLYQVARLLGHRDVRMTQRYAHLAVGDLERALCGANRVGGTGSA